MIFLFVLAYKIPLLEKIHALMFTHRRGKTTRAGAVRAKRERAKSPLARGDEDQSCVSLS